MTESSQKKRNNRIFQSTSDIDETFIPELADDIEIRFFKSDERGDFFLVRNPRNKRYVKVHESGKAFMETIDGTKTMAELQQTTDFDVYNYITILARGGFLANFEEQKKEEPFYNIKIPLFKSNHPLLTRMYEMFSFVASTPFKIFYALFFGFSAILFVMHLSEIFGYILMNFDPAVPMEPLILFMVIFYVVELAHELAHTGASYNYGAEPGDVGIEFHFLVGFFYVETPDTRMLPSRASIDIFIAGPLTSMFAAAICTYVFVFTDYYPLVWASSAFFWYVSTLITLSPFMQTDGYYIIQEILKFPNLFGHAVSYLSMNIFRLLGKASKEELGKTLRGHTKKEIRAIKILAMFIPFQVGILAFFFFFMALEAQIFHVLELAPVILSGDNPYGFRSYFLLFSYSFGIMVSAIVASLTAYRFFKQGPEKRW